MVFNSFSQTRKKQIEHLELKVDSLCIALNKEKTSNLLSVNELKSKISDFQNQINELKMDLMEKKSIIEAKDILIDRFKINAKQSQYEIDSLLAQLKLKNEEMNKSLNDYKNQIEQLRSENKIKSEEVNKKLNDTQIPNQSLVNKTSNINILKKDGKIINDSLLRLNNSTKSVKSTTNSNKNHSINYKSVKIGSQEWMVENLNTDRFTNGDQILQARTIEEWKKANENQQPAWCYYNNEPKNGIKYGKLYNWYAVRDPRGLAPKGWHIPTDLEWSTLIDYLGGQEIASNKMRAKRGWDWDEAGGGDNSSGFTALPGGCRHFLNDFSNLIYSGYWWSSTESYEIYAWDMQLDYTDGFVFRDEILKEQGMSVRCLKD